jgi:hypothetical protein
LIAVSGLLYGMTFQPALIVIFGLSVNRSSADCDLQRKTACRPNFWRGLATRGRRRESSVDPAAGLQAWQLGRPT